MKTLIAPIQLKTNNISEDQICLGLLVLNNQKIRYYISDRRMRVLSSLVPKKEEQFIKSVIKKWSEDWQLINQETSLINAGIEQFQDDLLNRWNRKTRSTSIYTETQLLDIPVQEHDFKELCRKYLGESPVYKLKKPSKNAFKERVKKIQKNKVFKTYRKNILLKPDSFKGLLSNYRVDLLDVDHQISAIQFLDLSMSPLLMERKVLRYDSFIKTLKELSSNTKGIREGVFLMAYKNPRKDKEKLIADKLLEKSNLSFEFVPLKDLVGKMKRVSIPSN